MRSTILITIIAVVVFAALRLAGVITPGWFLGLGALCTAAGIFMVIVMAGGFETQGLLQLGGFLLTLGIVLLIINWLLGLG